MHYMDTYKNENLAYWCGLVQADGYFKKKRQRGRDNYLIVFAVKDKILVEAFQKISASVLGRNTVIYKRRNLNLFVCEIGVTRLIPLFEALDVRFDNPPKPPKWILDDLRLFGAYLAGLIDGDGNVRIKRPEYLQCGIRITSGSRPKCLRASIKRMLGCGACITKRHNRSFFKKGNRIIEGSWYDLEFLVSSKTKDFIEQNVLPNIRLSRKSEPIRKFISDSRF